MATLTITLTESVSLNDREQGATNSFTVANVEFSVAFARLVTVTVPVVSPVCVIVKSATSK